MFLFSVIFLGIGILFELIGIGMVIAKGGAAFCSHCGYKIRLSEDGKIVNPG